MAIIELNLEKPALKRVESAKEQRTSDEQFGTPTGTTETSTGMTETTSGETTSGEMTTGGMGTGETITGEETSQQAESGGKSRTRKYGRRLAMVAGTAAGAAAVRKLRQRRKSAGQQQELEEDWQTAE